MTIIRSSPGPRGPRGEPGSEGPVGDPGFLIEKADDPGVFESAPTEEEGVRTLVSGDVVDPETQIGEAVGQRVKSGIVEDLASSGSLVGNALTDWLEDDGNLPERLTEGGLSATIASGAESTQALMAKLDAEVADAALLVVGDSTGNELTEWVYLLATLLGVDWPTWTIAYRLWNDGAGSYDAAVIVQTGTGPRTLTIYNASVTGASTTYWQGLRALAAINALTVDLVIVSLGHNEQPLTAAEWHGRMVGLTESVVERLVCPLILVAQNPATANTNQQGRRETYRRIAIDRGYGFLDVCEAFLRTPSWETALIADGIHPSPAGSALWAATVHGAFVVKSDRPPRPQPPSTLTVGGETLLRNGDFRDGDAYWTLSGCTSAVDTVNFETATNTEAAPTVFTSTARKFTAGGAGGTLAQFIPIERVKGRWVTLAVRLYVPTGQASSVGRVAILDSTGSTTTGAENAAQGAYRWVVVTRFIPTSATTCRALLYVDSSGTGGGSCTIDRVVMIVGKYPLAAAKSLPGPAGTPGASTAGQLDYISTVGSNPVVAALAGNSGNAGVVANQAMYAKFKPHRNITVSALVWQCGVQSGNYDIGIYSAAGTLLWSKGSTACPAAGMVTDTVSPGLALTAGTDYFVGFALDNATAKIRGIIGQNAEYNKLTDGSSTVLLKSSSFPLASGALGSTGYAHTPVVMVRGT